jgi:hypothetical protein
VPVMSELQQYGPGLIALLFGLAGLALSRR